MSYRTALPQLENEIFLTDGGLETDLLFNHGIDLPHFAACSLLRTPEGRHTLRRYFDDAAQLAVDSRVGLLLDTATWRANPDWIAALGYEPSAIEALNHAAVDLAMEVRASFERPGTPIVINGVIGPRGDGYLPGERQSSETARDYHATQVGILAASDVDLVSAMTMNYVDEAVGIALAARDAGVPVAISFTVETDGRLVTGESLEEAIAAVDAQTGSTPVYYMVNCCHPSHLPTQFTALERLRGYRPNASSQSHTELDESEVLDDGNPAELGAQLRALRDQMPALTILGGCCGTDQRHVAEIARSVRR